MLKFQKLSHLVIAVTTAFTIATVSAPLLTHQTNVTAHAATKVAADGPWKLTKDNRQLPELQQLHNGNQIYYSIAPNDRNIKLFQQSVADWNALGVINLVQVPWGDANSQITLQSSDNYSPDGNEDGNTQDSASYHLGDHVAIMFNTKVTLYKDLDDKSKVTKSVTTDHEIGHALGFAHDNRKLNNGKRYRKYRLTMNWIVSGKRYKLGGIEQRTLADHYDLQPSSGYLNTNC